MKMDPDAVYQNLMSALSDYEDNRGSAEGPEIDAANEMRDAVQALNDWLSRGGFLPRAWQRGDKPAETLTAVMSADDAYSLYESLENDGEGTMGLMDGHEVRIVTEVSKV
jgi:hypothetical protein